MLKNSYLNDQCNCRVRWVNQSMNVTSPAFYNRELSNVKGQMLSNCHAPHSHPRCSNGEHSRLSIAALCPSPKAAVFHFVSLLLFVLFSGISVSFLWTFLLMVKTWFCVSVYIQTSSTSFPLIAFALFYSFPTSPVDTFSGLFLLKIISKAN